MNTKINSEKEYSTKSNANRAYKAAGSPEGYVIDANIDGTGWYILPAAKPAGGKMPRNGNCRKVWDIADSMKDTRRKDVIAACVEAGINLGTAKTQYQCWYASQK